MGIMEVTPKYGEQGIPKPKNVRPWRQSGRTRPSKNTSLQQRNAIKKAQGSCSSVQSGLKVRSKSLGNLHAATRSDKSFNLRKMPVNERKTVKKSQGIPSGLKFRSKSLGNLSIATSCKLKKVPWDGTVTDQTQFRMTREEIAKRRSERMSSHATLAHLQLTSFQGRQDPKTLAERIAKDPWYINHLKSIQGGGIYGLEEVLERSAQVINVSHTVMSQESAVLSLKSHNSSMGKNFLPSNPHFTRVNIPNKRDINPVTEKENVSPVNDCFTFPHLQKTLEDIDTRLHKKPKKPEVSQSPSIGGFIGELLNAVQTLTIEQMKLSETLQREVESRGKLESQLKQQMLLLSQLQDRYDTLQNQHVTLLSCFARLLPQQPGDQQHQS